MKTALGEAGLRALLNNLKTQLDTKVDLDDGKVASSQMPEISWNSLKDRPFDEDATIPAYEYTWPTDTTGLVTVTSGGVTMHRVGAALSADELAGATKQIGFYTNGVLSSSESVVLDTDDIIIQGGIVFAELVASVLEDNTTFNGVTFDDAGLYLIESNDNGEMTRCDGLSRAAVTYKTKLSYNDLADRPCGDTENDDGYEYAFPADISDAESFDVTMDGTTITLYRIGDALTAEQLGGAVMRITFTVTQNGDTQDMSEESTIQSTDLLVGTGYIEVEGCIVSILSDNVTYSNVSVPHAGVYAVYVDADFEDGGVSYHVLQRINSLARANTVTTKQLDAKYIPPLSASQVPNLQDLNGKLTASQVPNLEDLNGVLTNSQLPKISADQLPTIPSSQISGLDMSWSGISNKPGGLWYQITEALIDYNTVRTVPANDGTDEYIRYYRVGDANQYVEIESLVGAQCGIDLSYDNNGLMTSHSYSNVQSYDADTSYGFGAMYIVSQDDMEMLYIHGACNDRPIFLLCPQMTYHGIMMGTGLWVAEYAPLFTLTKSAVFSAVRYGRRLKPQTWDDITDRPFGGIVNVDEYEIYGTRTSSSALVETTDGEQYTYFRLGNSMSLDDLLHARLQVNHGSITALQNIGMWLTLHNCASHTDGTSDWVEVSNPKGATLPLLISTGSDSLTLYGGTFTDGLWAIGTASGSNGGDYSLTRKCTVTQKLDPVYLPDSVKQVPTVTASDNGKVLRVVNGAWSAVSLPSASGVSF